MIHRNLLIVATTRRLLACWYRFGGPTNLNQIYLKDIFFIKLGEALLSAVEINSLMISDALGIDVCHIKLNQFSLDTEGIVTNLKVVQKFNFYQVISHFLNLFFLTKYHHILYIPFSHSSFHLPAFTFCLIFFYSSDLFNKIVSPSFRQSFNFDSALHCTNILSVNCVQSYNVTNCDSISVFLYFYY